MTKQEAITLFGGRVKYLAEALGVTSSAVSQMPEALPQRLVDQITGAAVRKGVAIRVLVSIQQRQSEVA
jgi:hypothetical protein